MNETERLMQVWKSTCMSKQFGHHDEVNQYFRLTEITALWGDSGLNHVQSFLISAHKEE